MSQDKNALFQLMKFKILSLASRDINSAKLPHAYIYAWDSGVYPLFNEGASWHTPFADCFSISENKVEQLSKFLDESWISKKNLSFYELESEFGVHGSTSSSSDWSRYDLVAICRYMYLGRAFDDEFWANLLENGKCPSEAHCIARELKESDIYLA